MKKYIGVIERCLVILLTASIVFSMFVVPVQASDTLRYEGEEAPGENQPVQHGYRQYDLLSWTPETDMYSDVMRARVPLQKRIDTYTLTQANPNLSDKTRFFNLSGDYGNSFFESTAYTNKFSQYLYNFWQYTDFYSYWHGTPTWDYMEFNIYDEVNRIHCGTLNIPNPAYTNAAHKNGALSLACLYVGNNSRPGETIATFKKLDENGIPMVAKKIVEMAGYYGFDGVFINDEELHSSGNAEMQAATRYLVNNGLYVQWYNAAGEVRDFSISNLKDSQERINANSWFLDYGWNRSNTRDSSVSIVKNVGLDPFETLFFGFEGGGARWEVAVSAPNDLSKLESSKNNFVSSFSVLGTDFVHHGLDEDNGNSNGSNNKRAKNEYQWLTFDRERIWFSGWDMDPTTAGNMDNVASRKYATGVTESKMQGIAYAIAERSVIGGKVFTTNFSTGHGLQYFSNGLMSNDSEWSNMNMQSILPTWQWWIDVEENASRLGVDFDYGTKYTRLYYDGSPNPISYEQVGGYNGGNSLAVNGTLNGRNFLRLYKTELEIDSDSKAQIFYNKSSADDGSSMKLGLIFKDGTTDVTEIAVENANKKTMGWQKAIVDLSSYAGNTIAAFGLIFDTDVEITDYQMNIGEITITDGGSNTPVKPTGFHVDKLLTTGEAYVSWDIAPYDTVNQYNVYAKMDDDSIISLGGIYDSKYYIKKLDIIKLKELQLKAVGIDGTESEAAVVDCSNASRINGLTVTKAEGGTVIATYTDNVGIALKAELVIECQNEPKSYTQVVDAGKNAVLFSIDEQDGFYYTLNLRTEDGNPLASVRGKLKDEICASYDGELLYLNEENTSAELPYPEIGDWKYITIKVNGNYKANRFLRYGIANYDSIKGKFSYGDKVSVILEDYSGNVSQVTEFTVGETPYIMNPKQGIVYCGKSLQLVVNEEGIPMDVSDFDWSLVGSYITGTGIDDNGLLTIAGNENATSVKVKAVHKTNSKIKVFGNFAVKAAEELNESDFPDSELYEWVIDNVGNGSTVDDATVAMYTGPIDLSDLNIKNFTGLKLFTRSTELIIKGNVNIEILNSNFFPPNIETLILKDCPNLLHIMKDAFMGLDNLKTIDITGSAGLKSLELGGIPIRNLIYGAKEAFPDLAYVDLTNTGMDVTGSPELQEFVKYMSDSKVFDGAFVEIPVYGLLSKGKVVIADKFSNVDRVVDGTFTNYSSTTSIPAHVTVDMGKAVDVDAFKFYAYGKDYMPTEFSISYSNDGIDFTEIKNVTGNNEDKYSTTFPSVKGRYFKFDVTELKYSFMGCMLSEIEFYGYENVKYAAAVKFDGKPGLNKKTLPTVKEYASSMDGKWMLDESSRMLVVTNSMATNNARLEEVVNLLVSEFADKELPGKQAMPIIFGAASEAKAGDIVVNLTQVSETDSTEGYKIDISDKTIISANSENAVLYAGHTLMNLIIGNDGIYYGTIVDYPDIAERSLHIDIGRKFYTRDWLIQRIREMSWMKLNTLQLHFSENEGFRIECESHPEVMSEQYLTKEDIRELLAVAKTYGIQVIPSLDTPGHMKQALVTHPELQLSNAQGGKINTALDITNEQARNFVKDLIAEYAELFKDSEYFHIGADEFIDFSKFSSYPVIEQYAINKYGPDATGLDAYVDYINDMAAYVKEKGFIPRIWNDGVYRKGITQNIELDKSIQITYWTRWDTNMASVQEFLEEGHDLINFNDAYFYYVLGENAGYKYPTGSKIFNSWHPGMFPSTNTGDQWEWQQPYPENFKGASFAIWSDKPNVQTQEQVAAGIYEPLRAMAQKSWNAKTDIETYYHSTETYEQFKQKVDRIGYAPFYNGVLPVSISLNESSLILVENSTAILTATVKPDNAPDKSVVWQSDNIAAATVDETGKITAVGIGTATITATTHNGLAAICTVTVVSDAAAPADVADAVVTADDGQLTISWTDPSDADFVHVTVTGEGIITQNVSKGIQSVTITGLTNGITYNITLKAVDTTGNESAGVTVSGTPTDETILCVSQNAAILGASGNGSTGETKDMALDGNELTKWCVAAAKTGWLAIDLGSDYEISRWRTVHGEKGDGAPGFNTEKFALQVLKDKNATAEQLASSSYLANSNNWTEVEYIDNSTSQAMVVDRTLGTSVLGRYFRLRIEDSTINQYTAVRIHEFQLYGKLPVTTAPAEVTDAVVTAGDGQLTISWTDPADEDFDHVIITGDGIAEQNVNKGIQSVTITGLTNGNEYEITLRTADAAGNVSDGVAVSGTPKADEVPDTTAPAEVTGATVATGDGQLTITWADPTDVDFDHVIVTGAAITMQNVAKGVQRAVITGLENGIAYEITLKTVDQAGNESEGVSISGTPTADPDITAPGEVEGASVSVGDGQLTITWTDPADADFDYVTVTGAAITAHNVAKGVQQTVITGLENGRNYEITLKTVDQAGNESKGVSISGTPTAGPDTTAPAEVAGATVATGDGQLTITWTDPTDADFDHVIVTGSGITVQNVNKGIQSVIITGLANGTAYDITLKTVDSTGNESAGVTVRGTPVAPSSPTPQPSNPAPVVEKIKVEGDAVKVLEIPKVDAATGIAAVVPIEEYHLEKALESTSADSKGIKLVTIDVPKADGAKGYSVELPETALTSDEADVKVKVVTATGSVTLPSNMLKTEDTAGAKSVVLNISAVDASILDTGYKEKIGNKPVINLEIKVDGKAVEWDNPNAPVTVSIPYNPAPDELANPESIVIWYIDGNGNMVSVPNGRFDPAAGTVTFTVIHFSYYAVGYNKVGFNDVGANAWYNKAVSFIAAREITAGTGNGNYSPDAKLTRGEFLVLMMKAYSIDPDTNPADNFSDAGSAYYTGYLAAAKRLGITAGVGSNMYAPGKEITRQEMFTMLYNALKVIGKLPEVSTEKTLSDFTDAEQIDSWAVNAMTLLVETGIVSGNAGKLTPLGKTTRAEISQVLYNLLGK